MTLQLWANSWIALRLVDLRQPIICQIFPVVFECPRIRSMLPLRSRLQTRVLQDRIYPGHITGGISHSNLRVKTYHGSRFLGQYVINSNFKLFLNWLLLIYISFLYIVSLFFLIYERALFDFYYPSYFSDASVNFSLISHFYSCSILLYGYCCLCKCVLPAEGVNPYSTC